MNTSTKRSASILIAFVCLFSRAIGQSEPEPERYALLAGVTNYEHPSLNGLKFPEDDVTALAKLLREQGYTVDLLLGKAATKAAIEAKLRAFKRRGMNSGVLFVGLSGHGMETTDPTTKSEKSYFCPFDTVMQAVRDAKGRIVPGNDGQQLLRYGNVKDAEYAKKFTNPYGDPITGNDGYVFTSPVGSFESNGFGLFDMHGNVWEWCQDVYDAKAYQGRSGVSRDPLSSLEGSSRVYRGGCWGGTPVLCRSAYRDGYSPGIRNYNLGFRVSLQSVR